MMRPIPLLLFALVAACTGLPPSVRTPVVREGRLAGADSVRLHFRAAGEGPDTLVVVHGFQGFGSGYLLPDLLPLSRGRVLILFDQRGDGGSSAVDDPARLDLDGRVRDLEAVRRELGLGRMSLLGHSGGAAVAVAYAAAHPGRVERLVLVAPPPPVAHHFGEQTMRAFQARLDSATWARVGALHASLPTSADPVGVCREIAGIMLPRAYTVSHAAAARLRGELCASPPGRLRTQPQRTAAFLKSLPADWRALARSVSAPVLVVHGERDAIPIAAAAAWREALPDARLVALPGADHLPWLDRPEAFFAALERFLRGGAGPPR